MPRSVRYLVSLEGNKAAPPTGLLCARIDLRRRRKKAQSVPHFYFLMIQNFPVGPPRHNFEQIAVRPNRRCREMPKLEPRPETLGHREMLAIDLNLEVVMLVMVLVFVVVFVLMSVFMFVRFFWTLISLLFVAHENLRFDILVSRYHTCLVLDKLGGFIP